MANPGSNRDIDLQVGVRSNDGERVRRNPVMPKQVHSDRAGLGPGWGVSQWVGISRVCGQAQAWLCRAGDQHSYHPAQAGAEGSRFPCGWGSAVRLVMASQAC